jgi:hypothetical protein
VRERRQLVGVVRLRERGSSGRRVVGYVDGRVGRVRGGGRVVDGGVGRVRRRGSRGGH